MIAKDYIKWLHSQFPAIPDYIFNHLAEREYIWQMDLDSNRAYAGTLLREMYSIDAGIYLSDVADGPCSVLEVLCALAIDMCDQSGKDDKNLMFQLMLSNLGIYNGMSTDQIDQQLNIWLYRQYDDQGHGNIFTVANCDKMTKIDTWRQMHIYLNSMFPFNENLFN